MKITYDNEAQASYIYFTSIGPSGVAETETYQRLDVGLDDKEQIVSMRLFESDHCSFRDRLKYVLHHPQVTYDEETRSLLIVFSEDSEVKRAINWDANVDIDKKGQILGVEILFADPEYGPDDGIERLYAEGKLQHLSKYIIPFDALY